MADTKVVILSKILVVFLPLHWVGVDKILAYVVYDPRNTLTHFSEVACNMFRVPIVSLTTTVPPSKHYKMAELHYAAKVAHATPV